MIQLRFTLITLLILTWFNGFAQTSETLTVPELRLITKIMTEAKRNYSTGLEKDRIIGTKEAKIEILQFQDTIRSEQVRTLNIELMRLEKVEKRLLFKIKIYKVATIVAFSAGVLVTAYFLK